MKRCPGYNGLDEHIEDETAFGKDASQHDGLAIYCKNCRAHDPAEQELPQFLGDMFERCRALTQAEIRRIELNKIDKTHPPKSEYIKEIVEILCKLKIANIGTTHSELGEMTDLSLKTLKTAVQSELESRRVQSELESRRITTTKSKSNDETATLPQSPSNKHSTQQTDFYLSQKRSIAFNSG